MRPTLDELFGRCTRMPNGCLEWQGARYWAGYGAVSIEQSTRRVHRVVWALLHGPIPTGIQILHRCDNPPCAEPTHLFAGTVLDNVRDMWAKGRGRPHIPDPAAVARARSLVAQGHSLRQAARLIGVNHETVRRWARSESAAA